MKKLMRIHLAKLLPGSKIKIHKDHGGYTAKVVGNTALRLS